MSNTSLSSTFQRAKKGKLIPRRKKLLEKPVRTIEGITRGIEGGIKNWTHNRRARKETGKLIKKGLKTTTAKDLAVNTGGFASSKLLAPFGKPAELAGDFFGAKATRRAINDSYALNAAIKQRKPGENPGKTWERVKKKQRTMGKIDKRNNAHTEDGVGWAIGNAGAESLEKAGVGIPLKGAAVAMRLGPNVSENIKETTKGKKTKTQAAKDIVKHATNENIVKPAKAVGNFLKDPVETTKREYRKGLKREAKLKRNINKKAKRAAEGYELMNSVKQVDEADLRRRAGEAVSKFNFSEMKRKRRKKFIRKYS